MSPARCSLEPLWLTDASGLAVQVFEFATSEHSGLELAAALSEVSGIKCSYSEAMPKKQMLELMPDVYHMVRFFEQVGYLADVSL